jgi:hypothetical protein
LLLHKKIASGVYASRNYISYNSLRIAKENEFFFLFIEVGFKPLSSKNPPASAF